MSKRSQELANDLARRAIAAAERRQHESGALDPSDLAQRLRGAVGDDGRLSVDQAIAALKGEEPAPLNPFAEEYVARREAKRHRDRELVFGPEPTPEEPSDRPQGSADGGEGEPENAEYEETPAGRMRVWTESELKPDNPKEDS